MAKFVDLLQHLWIPTIIIGMEGSAGLIRVMRNNLLDELQKPYVVAARARGLTELQLLLKYPVRVAINPFLATVGWLLPRLISGATIVSMVLNLPTTGPVQLDALRRQDMYLGASFTMMLATLTVLGTLVSDILLAVVDPRVRFE
jgi:peptide/nickel transport system permease protein